MKPAKKLRPFRVKRSYIVSVRHQHFEGEKKIENGSTGNDTKSKKKNRWQWQWLDPITNQDDTITLIGRRIRCILPKAKKNNGKSPSTVNGDKHQSSKGTCAQVDNNQKGESTSASAQASRAFEGEVISIFEHQPLQLRVALLVDDAILRNLERQINTAALPSGCVQIIHEDKEQLNNISQKERQMRTYEIQIRGKNKSVIHLSLPRVQNKKGIRWVIRKPVPYNTGNIHNNGMDDEIQQGKNIRWVSNHTRQEQWEVDHVRVGEVLNVKATPASASTSSSSQNKSLAEVTLRPLKFIEGTITGRMAHHVWNEICDISTEIPDSEQGKVTNITSAQTFTLPIEDLIVIAKRVKRQSDQAKATKITSSVDGVSDDELIIRYQYNVNLEQFEQQQNLNGSKVGGDERRTCHRCRTSYEENHMGQCQSKICQDGDARNNGGSNNKWWCKSCIKFLRKRCIYVLRKDQPFYGPCCLGSCDCKDCVKTSLMKNESSLKQVVDSYKRSIHTAHQCSSSMKSSPLPPLESRYENKICKVCFKKCFKYGIKCSACSRLMHKECFKWELDLWNAENGIGEQVSDTSSSVDSSKVKCYQCKSLKRKVLKEKANDVGDSILGQTANLMDVIAPTEFFLPFDLLKDPPETNSKAKHETKDVPPKKRQKRKKTTSSKKKSYSAGETDLNCNGKKRNSSDTLPKTEEFIPTASRTVPYDPQKKLMRSSNNSAAHAARSLACMRDGGRKIVSRSTRGRANDNKSNSRAARANQRRMLKENFHTGGVKEALSGQEHALRFGKSIIHGWGVFTDEAISADDLIVEYRGVIIGNAVADARELEYEKAKIGSDYMFRIDSEKVCDATHQGCVARFINASCNPNCYTQILTVNGVKRIAIYAKRNIERGEELSYDYKFEPEYDESKRIPCNCGTELCRGFMNWDQRYVAIKSTKEKDT